MILFILLIRGDFSILLALLHSASQLTRVCQCCTRRAWRCDITIRHLLSSKFDY